MQSIQSVGIVSCAKIMGVVYGALGLLAGPIFFLVMLVSALAGGHENRVAVIASGAAMLVFLPVFYGALGFAMGAVSAWIYNLAAGKFGGIQLELRDTIS